MNKNWLFLLTFMALASLGEAQNLSEKLIKKYTTNSWWLNLRYDHYLKSGSYVYLENNNRFTDYQNNQNNSGFPFGESFPFNSLYRTSLTAGYEHKAHEKWYLGLSERYVAIRNLDLWYTKVNISHRGKIASLSFVKEVAFEHIRYPKSDNPFVIRQNEGRVSFAPTLIKTLSLNDRPLYLLFSYRAFILFDWNNDDISSYDKRNIDNTRMRFEVSHFISDKLMLSVFAIRDTYYYYQFATFDQFMNEKEPEAKVNRVTPTFGIALNYVFRKPEEGFLPSLPGK